MSLRDKYTQEEWDHLEAQIQKKSYEKPEFIRVEILKDSDGHDYLVPYELKTLFIKTLEQADRTGDHDDFIESFESYMCGGDCFYENEIYIRK